MLMDEWMDRLANKQQQFYLAQRSSGNSQNLIRWHSTKCRHTVLRDVCVCDSEIRLCL